MGQRRLIVIVDYTYCKMGLASILTEHIVQNAHLFQYAHIILTVLTIRKEWSSAGIKGNPLAAFMLSMVCCNAGGFITAFLTGNKAPITIIFKLYADPNQMTIFLATFWLAFFAHESVASSLTRPSIQKALYIPKELLRCKKIFTGVALGIELYAKEGNPYAHLPYSILLGTISSCGSGFLINLALTLSGQGKNVLETKDLTKISIVLATLYTVYGQHRDLIVLVQSVYCLALKWKVLPVEFVGVTFEKVGGMLSANVGCEVEAEVLSKLKLLRRKVNRTKMLKLRVRTKLSELAVLLIQCISHKSSKRCELRSMRIFADRINVR